jgi:hypothetical protein
VFKARIVALQKPEKFGGQTSVAIMEIVSGRFKNEARIQLKTPFEFYKRGARVNVLSM